MTSIQSPFFLFLHHVGVKHCQYAANGPSQSEPTFLWQPHSPVSSELVGSATPLPHEQVLVNQTTGGGGQWAPPSFVEVCDWPVYNLNNLNYEKTIMKKNSIRKKIE